LKLSKVTFKVAFLPFLIPFGTQRCLECGSVVEERCKGTRG
jgi:hypothetical protein